MLGFGLGLNKWRRVGGGYVGLLDLYPNAAAAYSLRLLRKDYSGGLVRARAWDGSANQGEADVMAYRVSATEYVLDLNSTLENLDATAISRGLTTSDTLADLVSTGVNDYDGLTSAWYDQSLSNDATQTTAANQPKIVSAGSLVTENGNVAIDFDGVNDNFSISVGITAGFSIFGVYKNTKAASFLVGTSPELGRRSNNQYRFYDSTFSANGGTHSDSQVLLTGIEDDTNATIYANGTQIAQAASTFTNGTFDAIGWGFPDGNFQEIILFDSDQSANRTAIEANINNFYSIYP